LKLRLLLIAALGAATFVSGAGASPTAGQLVGSVGPGYTIKITTNGKAAKTLKAGTYKLVVNDKSANHDFHLFGPGLNKKITTVSFVGTKTVTVTLEKGTYRYQCDPHVALGMKGTFTVS
jgi:plastocyanin